MTKRRPPARAARIFTTGASVAATIGLVTGLGVWGQGPASPTASVTEPEQVAPRPEPRETIILRIVRRHHAAISAPAPDVVTVVRRTTPAPAPAPERATPTRTRTTSRAS